jgi:hypothetical protein
MSTLPGDWAEDEPQAELVPTLDEWEGSTGIPVRVMADETQRNSPEFCAWSNVTIGQAGTVSNPPYCTAILQRRIRRFKAKFSPVVFGTGTTAVVFNNRPDPLTNPTNPQGWIMVASGQTLPDYDAEQPLYAIAIGGVATVSYFDESYGFTKSS